MAVGTAAEHGVSLSTALAPAWAAYFDFPTTLCLLESVVNCLLVYFYEYV